MDGAAVEVAGIEQRHGAAHGFLAQGVFESEIHDAPCGDSNAQRGQTGAKAVHGFLRRGVAGRRGNMDELLGVVWVDDFSERKNGLGDVVAVLAAAAGDGEFVGLAPALHGVEDDVFLQNVVVAEGGLPGFEDVETAEFQRAQKVFAEWAEVRAIAETPGRDADELASGTSRR